MSCGLPVVCSNVCDNPNIAIDNESGYLFNPHEVNDIATKIERIAKMPVRDRTLIGINNRNRIETIYSKREFINQYISLVEIQ